MINRVKFPEEYHPRVSAIFASNDIDVHAAPSAVWDLLVDAVNWPDINPAAKDVRIASGEDKIGPGSRVTLTISGLSLVNTIKEFVPGERLAWQVDLVDHEEAGAYHGWVITPTGEGCHVLTEEAQHGDILVEELGRKDPGSLYRMHEKWLENIALAAARG